MSNFNVDNRTILLVKHGSHAYGLATETSDMDIKGVCIEPLSYHLGFLHSFEQLERMGKDNTDSVIYALKKFAKLATDSNPNIIEVLFGDDRDVLGTDEFGEELRAFRRNFLSLKAKHTFAGYAHSQLKRIQTHRSWLLNPPKQPPSRKDFGLSETFAASKTEMGAYEALERDGEAHQLSKEAQVMFGRERAYKEMVNQWGLYQGWKKNRNPARAALEEKFGLDTKHASHLIRLMRMCKEILSSGDVIVRRPDREELLGIKLGAKSYEEIMEEATRLEQECDALYLTSTALPKEPDRNKIDDFIVGLTDRYLTLHG
jgi:predicted nucleotidyltransferase